MPALKMRPARRLPLIMPKDAWEKEPYETVKYSGQTKVVYEEFLPFRERSEIRWKKDRDGGPVYTNAPPGTEARRRTERHETIPRWLTPDGEPWKDGMGERVRNPEAVREFILHQGFGTNIEKVYGFRESAEALERQRIEAENERAMERLLGLVRKNPAKIEKLLAEDDDPKPAANTGPSGSTPEASFTVEHKGGGRWGVFDHEGEPVHDDWLASKEEAEALRDAAAHANPPPGD